MSKNFLNILNGWQRLFVFILVIWLSLISFAGYLLKPEIYQEAKDKYLILNEDEKQIATIEYGFQTNEVFFSLIEIIEQYNNRSNKTLKLSDEKTYKILSIEYPKLTAIFLRQIDELKKVQLAKIKYKSSIKTFYKNIVLTALIPPIVIYFLFISIAWIIKGFKPHE